MIPEPTTTSYFFERQQANFCGRHALNNLIQFPLFTNEHMDPVHPNLGDWFGETLEQVLLDSGFTVTHFNADFIMPTEEMVEPIMVMICNGHHHVAVRRFVHGGPLVFFDSVRESPIIVGNDFWTTTFRNNDLVGNVSAFSVTDPLQRLMPQDELDRRVAARERQPDEDLLKFEQFQAQFVALHQSSPSTQSSNGTGGSQYVPPSGDSFAFPSVPRLTRVPRLREFAATRPLVNRQQDRVNNLESRLENIERRELQQRAEPFKIVDEAITRKEFSRILGTFQVEICLHCHEGHLLTERDRPKSTGYICLR